MVIRLYTRRHLMPCFRSTKICLGCHPLAHNAVFSRSISTPSTLSPTVASSATRSSPSGSNPSSGTVDWSTFSSQDLKSASSSSSSTQHPLITNLLSEIYSSNRLPSASRVWSAYLAISDCYIGPVSLMSQLQPVHHQHVLRAIDPNVAQTRSLSKLQRDAVAIKREQAKNPKRLLTSLHFYNRIVQDAAIRSKSQRVFDSKSSIRKYMYRVGIIFQEMRKSSQPSQTIQLPSRSDYNHVLSRLATGGHIAAMSSLWNQITAASTHDKNLQPNRETYLHLMIGLNSHASYQIERAQKKEAYKSAQYSLPNRQLEKSARAAAQGMLRYGEILAPTARAAAVVAALRAMALLKDMRDHNVKPNQKTLDLAARSLRLAGYLEGIHLLMQQVYAIDLRSPDSIVSIDSPDQVKRHPNLHTINTVVMALGEQATIPEMIAAYEMLTMPLDICPQSSIANGQDDGLFDAGWTDQLPTDEQTNSNSSQPPSLSKQIQPNTKTFEIMLRHCCTELDYLRSPIAINASEAKTQSVSSIIEEATKKIVTREGFGVARAQEMAKRAKGQYVLFAKYLIQDALDKTISSVNQMAAGLGIDIVPHQPSATNDTTTSAESTGRPEYFMYSIKLGRALERDFLPAFNPPSFSITPFMLTPFISLISQRKRYTDMNWIRSIVSKALAIKVAESKLMEAASQLWQARLRVVESSHEHGKAANMTAESVARGASVATEGIATKLAPVHLNADQHKDISLFLSRLQIQYRFSVERGQEFETLLYSRMDERFNHIKTQRLEKRKQKINMHREQALKVQAARLEEEQKRLERKTQAAEARKLQKLEEYKKATQEQQEDRHGESIKQAV